MDCGTCDIRWQSDDGLDGGIQKYLLDLVNLCQRVCGSLCYMVPDVIAWGRIRSIGQVIVNIN